MAGFYQTLTAARTTEPDQATLLAQLRALDATAGIQHTTGTTAYIIKKNSAWTPAQITSAQNVLNAAPASSAQLTAQNEIDTWPISQKALVLAILDAINTLRTQPTTVLPAITPAQVLQAIRDKAATL